jgi:hypothetical protein
MTKEYDSHYYSPFEDEEVECEIHYLSDLDTIVVVHKRGNEKHSYAVSVSAKPDDT